MKKLSFFSHAPQLNQCWKNISHPLFNFCCFYDELDASACAFSDPAIVGVCLFCLFYCLEMIQNICKVISCKVSQFFNSFFVECLHSGFQKAGALGECSCARVKLCTNGA